MSVHSSMGGIISQGSKVEKLQDVQYQGPESQRKRALTAAEEQKLKKQQRVRKTPESEESLTVAERDGQKKEGQESGDPGRKTSKSGQEWEEPPKKPGGSHIIDIVV